MVPAVEPVAVAVGEEVAVAVAVAVGENSMRLF
jgi:hypothetical protein